MSRFVHALLGIILFVFSCTAVRAENPIVIIPAPQKIEVHQGQFQLSATSRIVAASEFKNEAELLAARLRPATGFVLKIKSGKTKIADGDVVLTTSAADASLGPEGYELFVMTNGVVVRATTAAGIFYGTQSLLQLLPPEIFFHAACQWNHLGYSVRGDFDSPRVGWRGLMLDVSRHFFTRAEVEKVLDLMAVYKLNTFHWHLVDDQGWRIQIKNIPNLPRLVHGAPILVSDSTRIPRRPMMRMAVTEDFTRNVTSARSWPTRRCDTLRLCRKSRCLAIRVPRSWPIHNLPAQMRSWSCRTRPAFIPESIVQAMMRRLSSWEMF